jgi:hypothetical protein
MRYAVCVLAVTASLATLVASPLAPLGGKVLAAGCDPGDKIDGSTATQARQRIEAAGYRSVSDLKKSCDNFWHGMAVKNGVQVRVALSPHGLVELEGD